MIKVKNIRYKYESSDVEVFNDISFQIGRGEICAIIGKNGSGKTTLIKCLMDILKISEGTIDIPKPTGYVPQSVNLVYNITVLDAIVMGRYHYIGPFSQPSKKDYQIARECAERLKISHLLEKSFQNLSGGQQQLVLFARALAVGSESILFDEPFSALDFGNQNRIMSIIKSLQTSGITVLFSTHDPNHVLYIADKVLILEGGDFFQFGPVAEIMTDEVLSNLYGMK